MQLTESRNNDTITLYIIGRVDTNTSPQLQAGILTAFQKVGKLILDFGKCEYISSAGLRALLIGQKTASSKRGYMKLKNVPELMMSILTMSGFVDFLTIE